MAVTATLASHIIETRRLLHDATGTYWTDADLTAHVNRALQQRDRDSGMNRAIRTLPLVAGQATYDILAVDTNAYDVLSIILLQDTRRFALRKFGYTETTLFDQPTTTATSDPNSYARIGATQVYIAPIPQRVLMTEWDILKVSSPLGAATDIDTLPYPWTDPVPFLAASFAKIQFQSFEEAKGFEAIYKMRLIDMLAQSQTRLLPEPYLGIER